MASMLIAPLSSTLFAMQKTNVLWIFIEDMNPLLESYGDPLLKTPNFDRLAANGVLFENCFTPAPVCSPCRSGLITGMNANRFGAHNHRTFIPKDVPMPPGTKTLPEIFREHDYYTFNSGKTDYNFAFDLKKMYNQQCSNRIILPGNKIKNQRWNGYPSDKPFFGQLQREGGKLKFYYHKIFNLGSWDKRAFKMDPQRAAQTLPPYYPKDPILLKNWAEHYDSVAVQDWDVGTIIKDLEQKKLLENTVIFTFSDHGLYLPREKQFCYDGGLHVPLIISYFGSNPELKNKLKPGTRRKDLVSLLDVSATSLNLAGIDIPEWYDSKDLFAADYKREYLVGCRDRDDFTIDRIRSVRTENFKYIRNYMTDRPYMQPQYRDGKDYVIRMRELHKQGKLTPEQDWFWADERPAEELYDLRNDPYELHNLAETTEYKTVMQQHRDMLAEWIENTGDRGQYPESDAQLLAVLKVCQKRRSWTPVNPEYKPIKEKYSKELNMHKQSLKRGKKGEEKVN